MLRRLHILWLAILAAGLLSAQTLSEKAEISLLTCAPGEELYARYGHTALRVSDPEQAIDWVFNYGLFDFHTEHFYLKFMRGETYYMLGAQYSYSFYQEYAEDHREIYSQTLLLDSVQRQLLFDKLMINYQPENRSYLYNFVFDNCATRPYRLIAEVLNDSISSSYQTTKYPTYRELLSYYAGPHSWADFGINLLFGPKADRVMTQEQRLFLPEELMQYMAHAHRADGLPVVSKSHIGTFHPAPVAWYADSRLGLMVLFLLLVWLSIFDRRNHRWTWGVDLALGIVYVVILLIVAFLTFFSLHPLVGFGIRLLILPAIHLCARLICIF